MVMIKKHGFTLAEVLLAVTIVGVIVALTIPSLLRNTHEKSRMALLKGTVATVSSVIQSEMLKQRTTEITSTDIYKNPKAFLEKFELAKSGEPFGTTYKRYSDATETNDVLIPDEDSETQASVLLKNGVGLGIVNDKENSTTSVIVDLTGSDKPNMVGADYYIMKIEWYDNETSGIRAGDVTSYKIGGVTGAALKTECTGGNGAKMF